MYDIPIDAMYDALRSFMGTAWGFLASTPIPESGGPKIALRGRSLPIGCIEADGELLIEEASDAGSLKSINETLVVYLWLFRKATAGADDVSLLRGELRDLAKAILADRTLNGTATNALPISLNWTGEGREWPVDLEGVDAITAGYVGVRVEIEDA